MARKILIAEDDDLAAITLYHELTQQGYQCSRVSTGKQTIDFLLKTKKTDLLILDMVFSDFTGPLICRSLRQQENTVPILGLTAFDINRYSYLLALFGAQGLLPKSSYRELGFYINTLTAGGAMPGFEPINAALIRFSNTKQTLSTLSITEEKIISLRINGFSNSQISQYLDNKPSTVRKHWQNILRKLHCSDIEQACRLWETEI